MSPIVRKELRPGIAQTDDIYLDFSRKKLMVASIEQAYPNFFIYVGIMDGKEIAGVRRYNENGGVLLRRDSEGHLEMYASISENEIPGEVYKYLSKMNGNKPALSF